MANYRLFADKMLFINSIKEAFKSAILNRNYNKHIIDEIILRNKKNQLKLFQDSMLRSPQLGALQLSLIV